MAARQFLCSVALCSAWLPCGGNWVTKEGGVTKALTKILLVLTAVAALSVAHPAKANLITNPGFETGDLTGWNIGAGFFVTGPFDGVSPHSGNFQAVTATGFVGQTLATTPGQSYTVDFWAATIPMAVLEVLWNNSIVFNHLFRGVTGYTEFTFNVTASSASTEIQFFGESAPFETGLILDDISVNPAGVGVPDGGSTVSMLGFGLLGLAALRRKLGY